MRSSATVYLKCALRSVDTCGTDNNWRENRVEYFVEIFLANQYTSGIWQNGQFCGPSWP